MLNKDETDVIPHAGKIIDRFGGIRPMASKLQVPVTTVQGWKKRDVIPATRLDDILKAAKAHSVNINGLGLPVGGPANQNAGATVTAAAAIKAPEPRIEARTTTAQPDPRAPQQPRPAPERPARQPNEQAVPAFIDIDQLHRETTRRSLAVSVAVAVVVLAVAVFLFSRDVTTGGEAYKGLAGRVSSNEARLAKLERSPASTPGGVALLGEQVQNMEQSFSQRIAQIENSIGTGNLTQMAQNVEAMAQGPEGQQLGQAMSELRGLADSTRGRMDNFDTALRDAKVQNRALGQALNNLSARDVSAGAMLLALYQFRTIIGREEPFERDLALLRRLTSAADPALGQSLAKLEPYASTGILSPETLSAELSGLAGEIAMAGVSGQELSVTDRIMSRLKNLLSIKKDGEPVSTEEQDKQLVAQAQQRFARGDVRGALRNLQQLNPQAAETARPVTEKANAYVEALNAQDMLVMTLIGRLSTAGASTPVFIHPPEGAAASPAAPATPADIAPAPITIAP